MNERRTYKILFSILRPLQLLLFPIRQKGREQIPEGACIICTNHSSIVDPVLLAMAMTKKHHPRFMAKIEIARVPVLGWLLKKAGMFFVDRGAGDVGAIRKALALLKSGEMVMIFPEGTRVGDEDAVAAKSGAVRLAAKLGVPIIPAYIERKKKLFRRNRVTIGQPYYIDKTDVDYDARAQELMEKIYALESVQ